MHTITVVVATGFTNAPCREKHTCYSMQGGTYKLQHAGRNLQARACREEPTCYSMQGGAYMLQHAGRSLHATAAKLSRMSNL